VSIVAFMLNPLQGLEPVWAPQIVDTAWPVAGDALECYWDELFGAVCGRLALLGDRCADPTMRDGMLECVAALAQLRASAAQSRARQSRGAVATAEPSSAVCESPLCESALCES